MSFDALLSDPTLKRVMGALSRQGHRALVVGGAVRNILMGVPVSDVDLATDARPEEVEQLAAQAGLRSIPTGRDHGTITLRCDGENFEVTTFRKDVETDGRHARVVFSTRVEDDAARRDFTMNALYLDGDGRLIDPIGGRADVEARYLRFIGAPAARITEDYLRILRLFRFRARYAHRVDPAALEAVAHHAHGLERVSAERIGDEFRKILAVPDPAPTLALMAQTAVLGAVLDATRPDLAPLIAAEQELGAAPDWRRRLAWLGDNAAAEKLRLSRSEAQYLTRIIATDGKALDEIAYRHGAEAASDAAIFRRALGEHVAPDWQSRIARAAQAPLPISAADLMPELSGPALGLGLREAERLWIESDFRAPSESLIQAARLAAAGGKAQ